jgi:hypothetical protein
LETLLRIKSSVSSTGLNTIGYHFLPANKYRLCRLNPVQR